MMTDLLLESFFREEVVKGMHIGDFLQTRTFQYVMPFFTALRNCIFNNTLHIRALLNLDKLLLFFYGFSFSSRFKIYPAL